MVSILGRKRTLADKTVYQNGSFDTSFDPSLFSLDSIFNRFFFHGCHEINVQLSFEIEKYIFAVPNSAQTVYCIQIHYMTVSVYFSRFFALGQEIVWGGGELGTHAAYKFTSGVSKSE
jgi:hypothetical protein